MQDVHGYTPLALAAHMTGNREIAQCLINTYGGRDALTIKIKDGEIPLLLSAAEGHPEMTRYLYHQTDLNVLVENNFHRGVLLFTYCIKARIFDVALNLVDYIEELPLTHEYDDIRPLYALACMPSAFPSGSRFGYIEHIIYNILRPEKLDIELENSQISIKIVSEIPSRAGSHEMQQPPYTSFPAYLESSIDHDPKVGAALQMQKELQWFKMVEKIVHPSCREAKNKDGKTAYELFTENHKEMLRADEKWVKEMAVSFTIVGTLIMTITFASAFRVLDENKKGTGFPMFLNDNWYSAFIIAGGMSFFTSSAAVLIFIGILYSKYTEKRISTNPCL
ncbi:hypothetical protein VNO77_40086 [Canavalia gladiata]|uniref:PGG domain-containing protein n=1 Tax=Canavalia gladiata TaxID=3824 RepID=A0AAN9PPF0_CANGL